jgi:GNAT superfamily N-acetyltransferase
MATSPFETHPLTPDRWDDFAALFGDRGACGGCWCMHWRESRKAYEANMGDGNREAMRSLVKRCEEPGLIGYIADEAVAWCAVAPRTEFTRLGGSRILAPIDDRPVWSIPCFFVRKTHRRKGLSVELLRAAIGFVRERGGHIVEGYPVEPNVPMVDTFAYTGIAAAFLAAGFHEYARRSDARPIMRFEIEPKKRRPK